MKEGVPALVILNPAGKVIPALHHIDWSQARRFAARAVLRHLEELRKAANAHRLFERHRPAASVALTEPITLNDAVARVRQSTQQLDQVVRHGSSR
jgi:hypothetical protein